MYKKLLIAIITFGLLSFVLSACAIRDAGNGPVGPTVHMGGSSFIQTTVTLHKGDTLNLVDDTGSPHIVVNGSWDGTTAKPANEAGAPSVNLHFNGNDNGSAGPWNTAGTFHLYCTIHPGMNLTVIVQ